SEVVGSHSDSTFIWSLRAACCRESVVAWCDWNSVLKSPRIPMRTPSLTGLIVLEPQRWAMQYSVTLGLEAWCGILDISSRACGQWRPFPRSTASPSCLRKDTG